MYFNFNCFFFFFLTNSFLFFFLFSVLIRGKSISNENLVTEKDDINFDDDIIDGGGPIEWKRVSKIRRSLQYPKASTPIR